MFWSKLNFFQLCSFNNVNYNYCKKKNPEISPYDCWTILPIPNYDSVMIQLLYCYNSDLILSLSFQPSQKQWHHQTFKRSLPNLAVFLSDSDRSQRSTMHWALLFPRPLRSVLSENIVQTFCCIDSTPWRQIRAPLWRTTGEVDILQQATGQPHSLRCASHQTRIHD